MSTDIQAARGLADDALDNLVHQFARPLDFLRELVQNSIDAGTPRIEVRVRYTPAEPGDDKPGVVAIHVDDWGEGMDEAIIDSQLTRMFSSTKEDDLTKIGKFGIGFTSIFAIQPARTGSAEACSTSGAWRWNIQRSAFCGMPGAAQGVE